MARLDSRQRKEAEDLADERARRRRAERAIENISNIPDRDTTDEAGRPSEGLGRKKLKYRDLTGEELATNAVDGRVIKPAEILGSHIQGRLPAGSVQQIGDLDGNLPDGKLPSVPKTKLPNDTNYGPVRVGKTNLENNAVHPADHIDWTVPKDDFIPISKLASRPWPSQQAVNGKTAPADVVRLIRRHVKKNAQT